MACSCLVCGDPVEQPRTGRKRKYCSDKCAKIAQKHQVIEWKHNNKNAKRCPTCGRVVPVKRNTTLPVLE